MLVGGLSSKPSPTLSKLRGFGSRLQLDLVVDCLPRGHLATHSWGMKSPNSSIAALPGKEVVLVLDPINMNYIIFVC